MLDAVVAADAEGEAPPRPRIGRRASITIVRRDQQRDLENAAGAADASRVATWHGTLALPEEVVTRVGKAHGAHVTFAQQAEADEEQVADFLDNVVGVAPPPAAASLLEEAGAGAAVDALVGSGGLESPGGGRGKRSGAMLWRGITASIISALRGETVAEVDVERAAFAANTKIEMRKAARRKAAGKVAPAGVPDYDQPVRLHTYAASFGTAARDMLRAREATPGYYSSYSSFGGKGVASMGSAKRELLSTQGSSSCAVGSYTGMYSSFTSKGFSGWGRPGTRHAGRKAQVRVCADVGARVSCAPRSLAHVRV